MIAEYRIKNIGGKCYPQVRFKRFLFGWTTWKRISKHVDGWGLYDSDGYPTDAYDCESVISEYHIESRHTTYGNLFPNK